MGLKQVIEVWKKKPIQDILIELYITKDLTMPQVAEELGISVGSVHKWLAEYGIGKQEKLFEKTLS